VLLDVRPVGLSRDQLDDQAEDRVIGVTVLERRANGCGQRVVRMARTNCSTLSFGDAGRIPPR